MIPDKDNIQARFLERISRTLPPSVSLVDGLCSVLKISMDSAYRRINCVTPLTIHETELLSNMYKISFDSLCNYSGNLVYFNFNPMSHESNFKDYILSIRRDLEIVYMNKGTAVYAAEDIPLFYNFGFPALAKFKIFYWMKSVMNVESLQNIKYSGSLVDEEIIVAGKELYDMYVKVPSIEIWTEITPMSLFKQIEFFWVSGFFGSKEDALAICDDAKELFALLEKAASLGCKIDSKRNPAGGQNNFQLYWSEIEIGNNCIVTDIEGDKTSYLAFNTFNKLNTHDQSFCNETDTWLKNLIRKSNLISGISEKQRSLFFNKLNEALDSTRRKITG